MISIVIPVFNSQATITKLCMAIIKKMESINLDYEIILVDDKSFDDSYSIIRKLNEINKNIKCIKLLKNVGQQNALFCGLTYGNGDYFVTMDDDFQNSPKDIINLYNKILQGYDVVYAIPIKKKHSEFRNYGTRFTDWLFTSLLNKPKEIKISSFRIMNKNIINKLRLESNSFIYLSAAIFKHTKNVANINVNHFERISGKSNYNIIKLLKLFINIIIYYSNFKFLNVFRRKKPQFEIEEVLY